MSNTPFTSQIFIDIWKKHFVPNKLIKKFQFIEGVSFYKSNFLPVFFNAGKNLTKGNNYKIHDYKDYKNKTFIIYDVLPHLKDDSVKLPKDIKILKSNQYPGFLIDLTKFSNIDEYLLKTFSKNTRMKMRKFSSRLDTCFNISTKMFFGNIDKKEYESIFDHFMVLLQKRYSDKQISNNNMLPSEWNFYRELAYPLIMDKKASLFVIYDNKVPINITYNYHTEDTLIDAMTVFDIDYSKFNIGYVNNLKILNWCFENNLKTLDFSKGYFDYKKRMCSLEYNFEYHILFDNNSIKAKMTAFFLYKFYEFKSSLRNKGINTVIHKLTFLIKNKKTKKAHSEMTELNGLPDINTLSEINFNKEKHAFLNKNICDFLYSTSKNRSEIKVYSVNNQNDSYIISCETLAQKISLKL